MYAKIGHVFKCNAHALVPINLRYSSTAALNCPDQPLVLQPLGDWSYKLSRWCRTRNVGWVREPDLASKKKGVHIATGGPNAGKT